MKNRALWISLFLLLMVLSCKRPDLESGRPDTEQDKAIGTSLGWGAVCTAEFDNKHLENYQYIVGPRECVVKIAVFANGQPLEGIGISLWFANYFQTTPEMTDAKGLASFLVDAGSYEIVRWEINHSESNAASADKIRTMDLCDFGISMARPLTTVAAIPLIASSANTQWPVIRYCSHK